MGGHIPAGHAPGLGLNLRSVAIQNRLNATLRACLSTLLVISSGRRGNDIQNRRILKLTAAGGCVSPVREDSRFHRHALVQQSPIQNPPRREGGGAGGRGAGAAPVKCSVHLGFREPSIKGGLFNQFPNMVKGEVQDLRVCSEASLSAFPWNIYILKKISLTPWPKNPVMDEKGPTIVPVAWCQADVGSESGTRKINSQLRLHVRLFHVGTDGRLVWLLVSLSLFGGVPQIFGSKRFSIPQSCFSTSSSPRLGPRTG